MRRLFLISILVSILAPGLAAADYLYDAFRAECDVQVDHYYSAADPVIGTVALEKSEVGRVGLNYLVYGGFRYSAANDLRGHLYAVRLFKENEAYSNEWVFTDTSASDLLSKESCQRSDSACLFDAGQRLKERSQPRRIYAGVPQAQSQALTNSNGAYTIPLAQAIELPMETGSEALAQAWSKYVALTPISAAMPTYNSTTLKWENCDRLPTDTATSLCDPAVVTPNSIRTPSSAQFANMVSWLHGVGRNWPLGDIYHASATVVEPPGYEYKDRGYPQFRESAASRPAMIYVGANDGMIHAFYASPDLENPDDPRWEPGDEAWAYLPMNQLARTLYATEKPGTQRFFSQDLSCRYTDVQVDRRFTAATCPKKESERTDKYCGWRTILLCGQGWGGSWYLALDVSDAGPGVGPKPLWEFTHLDPNNKNVGLGRTWSLPSISLAPMEVQSDDEDNDGVVKMHPAWLAVFGNGYNVKLQPTTSTPTKPSYRALNLPLDGTYPEHGKGTPGDPGHAYVLDMATGKLVYDKDDGGSGNPIVADSTMLDLDNDGIADVGYLAGFLGMNRLFIGTKPNFFDMCNLPADSNGPYLTAHPTAFALPDKDLAALKQYRVLLVTGGGIDSGHTPDEQANNGNKWDIIASLYTEKKDKACPTASTFDCPLVLSSLNEGDRKARLLGAPLLTKQPNDDVWLVYTVWTAPHHNKICGKKEDQSTGKAYLVCMDVTLNANKKPRCQPCEFSAGDQGVTLLYDNLIQPPSSPVSADGVLYMTNPQTGISVTGVVDSDGEGPNANTNRPQAAVPARLISWREVYASE